MLTLTSPFETPLHRWPAWVKLALLCGFTLVLFQGSGPIPAAVGLLLVALAYLTCGLAFARAGLVLLRPLLPFLAIVTLWHLLTGDLVGGAVILLRLLAAMAAANLVTLTTRLSDLLAVLEVLCRPLAPILPPRRLALAIALAIRFVPVLAERVALIRAAWSARSPRRPGWRILIPTALAALDEAEQVADALRARGGAG